MTEPAAFDETAVPAVTLAGRDWPIPELAWRDLKKCRQELLELTRRINAVTGADPGAADESAAARGVRHLALMSDLLEGLSNEDYDRLVMGPLFAGLVASHPTLTRAEVESWASTESERLFAWLLVRRQSGLFLSSAAPEPQVEAPADPGEGDGAP
jgi:hypothetical protein